MRRLALFLVLAALLPLGLLGQTTGPGVAIAPGTAPLNISQTAGWVVYQILDTAGQPTPCSSSASSCVITTGTSLSGTMKAICAAIGLTGITISSATSTGDTWVHPTNTAQSGFDCIYAASGASGNTSVTVNFSGTYSGGAELYYYEVKPPATYSGSFDASGSVYDNYACLPCAGVPLTLTGTDFVVQMTNAFFTNFQQPNGWTNGYQGDWLGFGEGVNESNGGAPSVLGSNFPTSTNSYGPAVVAAVAFKSTAGYFTTPTPTWTLKNSPDNQSVSCSPSCSLNILINSTTGDLGVLSVASQTASCFISSATIGGGSLTVPAGAQQSSATAKAISAAYTLNATGGASSISLTMTCSGTVWWDYVEVAKAGGSPVLDQISAATNTTSVTPAGVALGSLTGTNDFCFQGIQEQTAIPYAQTYLTGGYNGGGNQNSTGWGSSSYGLNMSATNAAIAPTWFNNVTAISVVWGGCWK